MIEYRLNPFTTSLRGLISIAVMILTASLSAVQAGSPFPSMKCLGDSLSDTGRFHEETGGALPPPY